MLKKVKELSLWPDKQRRKEERAERPSSLGGASGRWSAALRVVEGLHSLMYTC